MNLNTLNRTISLLAQLVDTKRSTIPKISTATHKPPCPAYHINQPFKRSTPESENVPSSVIQDFLHTIDEDEGLDMHNIMILRHGKVIAEFSRHEQSLQIWKHFFSASKSVTCLAIGVLFDRGLVSPKDKVVDIFSKSISPINKIRLKDMTVEDLLTMRSTIIFNEAESMTETDWLKCFFNSALRGEMGKTFSYNSLNSYVLSAMVLELTGKHLCELLNETIFGALGITDYYWEKCPMGIEKGGWGLHLFPEDMAKLGQLMMNEGTWNKQRILSKKWIRLCTTKKAVTPEEFGAFHYGYQMWCGRDTNTFLFNGMFGQNMLAFRDSGIILLSNAGNNEMFQQSSYYSHACHYFGELFDTELSENPEAYKALTKSIKALKVSAFPTLIKQDSHFFDFIKRKEEQFPKLFERLSGICYEVRDESAKSTGLMPVAMQAIQNNYTKGLTEIQFELCEEQLYLNYREADESFRFPIGFSEPVVTELNFHDEPYLITASGCFAYDEDGNHVLKLRIVFNETPHTTTIKIFFMKDKILLKQTESPGRDFIIINASELIAMLKEKPVIGSALSKFDSDYVFYRLERMMSSRIYLYPKL